MKRRTRLGVFALGTLQLAAVVGIVFGTIRISEYMKTNQPARVQLAPTTYVPRVQSVVVETETRVIRLQKSGTVEPSVYISLAPEVSGVVDRVAPGLGGGAVFAAGEPLFEISRDDLEIELRRREADLAGAQASLDIEIANGENARREWDSFGRGEITDLAARGPQIRQARAQVLTAQASLDAARLDLERASFRVPFAGRVVDLSLALGQKVSEGQTYGTVYNFDDVEVSVALSSDELALLGTVVGTKARIEAQAMGQAVTLEGAVARVAGEVNRTTRLTTLVVALDPEAVRQTQLSPGTFASVTFEGPQLENVAEVPNTALQDNDQIWIIEEGRLRRALNTRPILRGRESSLVTGLPNGARIAIGAISGATEGMEVHFEARSRDQSTADAISFAMTQEGE